MKPTMGRIVLYTEDGETSPAVITRVGSDEVVDLFLFATAPPEARSSAALASVRRADVPTDGRWHWPPRVS